MSLENDVPVAMISDKIKRTVGNKEHNRADISDNGSGGTQTHQLHKGENVHCAVAQQVNI